MQTDGKDAGEKQIAKGDSISGMIEKLKPQLEKALPQHVTTERLARVALTAVRRNSTLQKADAMSLMGSIMTAAQLGLEPNTPLGQCYIIPYKNGKTGGYDAQFQMGYQGYIDLAGRKDVMVDAHAVDKNDTFNFSIGLGKEPDHRPADNPSGEKTHYWAEYMLPDGRKAFRMWTKEQVIEHAKKYSKSYNKQDSAWKTAFDSMAKKTVIRDLLKYAPKSIEVADAIGRDEATLRFNENAPEDAIETEFEVGEESEQKGE